MAKVKPRITLKQIREAATEKSFQRGEDYQSQGAIQNVTRQDFRLRADCLGSELYDASVTLNKDGIQSSSCTCFYDWDGLCKHQVALLLTLVDLLGDRLQRASDERLSQVLMRSWGLRSRRYSYEQSRGNGQSRSS